MGNVNQRNLIFPTYDNSLQTGCVSRPPFWKAVADLNPATAFSMPPCVRDLPLAELRSVKGNDVVSEDRALPGRPIDGDRLSPAQASTVLTKGAGFVFGDLGFFQDEIDRE